MLRQWLAWHSSGRRLPAPPEGCSMPDASTRRSRYRDSRRWPVGALGCAHLRVRAGTRPATPGSFTAVASSMPDRLAPVWTLGSDIQRRRPSASARLFSIKSSALYIRSEEHTSELQSRGHLVCRLLLEKKKTTTYTDIPTLLESLF